LGITVSVRLDAEAHRALSKLESSGSGRPEAVREPILQSAAALRRKQGPREETVALEDCGSDRRELLGVAALMEFPRAEG
jgi:hypothetical protein